MRPLRRLSLLIVAVVALVAPTTTASATPAPPTVMAAAGDSITQGFDATLFPCFLTDCPQYSWSIGTSSAVNSHLKRLRALPGGSTTTAVDVAKTGAKMAALAGQLQTAGLKGAQYVTVLMGANDACASTPTPIDDFRAQFTLAMTTYQQLQPSGRIFVSSIPDLYRLWQIESGNRTAVSTWRSFGICPSVLGSNLSVDQRRAAGETQVAAYNGVLRDVCTSQAFSAICLWDQNVTFQTQFTTKDVSTVDYFHPSPTGQNTLAAQTWAVSYWGQPSL